MSSYGDETLNQTMVIFNEWMSENNDSIRGHISQTIINKWIYEWTERIMKELKAKNELGGPDGSELDITDEAKEIYTKHLNGFREFMDLKLRYHIKPFRCDSGKKQKRKRRNRKTKHKKQKHTRRNRKTKHKKQKHIKI